MGWKLSCIFMAEKNLKESFSSSLVWSNQNLQRIELSGLLSEYEVETKTNLESVRYPALGKFGVGAYENGMILCHPQLPAIFFDGNARRKMVGKIRDAESKSTELINLFPDGQMLTLMLHSVVNFWAFSLYEKGKLIRCAAGSSDNGIIANEGEPLPEEQEILNGKSLLSLNESGDGEDLVLQISKRLYGLRMDELVELNQPLLLYKKQHISFLNRLFPKKS
jgi:hypothetical protein